MDRDSMKKSRKEAWNIRQWIKEKGLDKWFRRENLIVLILCGMLLFVIAWPIEKKKEDPQGKGEEGSTSVQDLFGMSPGDVQGQESAQEAYQEMTDAEYAAWMEQRLTEALSQVAGVGKVEVMITLRSSRELVVEREQPVTRSAINEADSQGGSRITSQLEAGDTVVYRSEGSNSVPYVIKTLPPEIEGVLVVAEGAGSGTINRTVTIIVQALFGVEAHKVSVVRMETK